MAMQRHSSTLAMLHCIAALLLAGLLVATRAADSSVLTQGGGSAVVSQLGTGAMICYTDTAEFFSQAIAVPNVNTKGESISCFSYSCTAEGASSSKCQTPISHGWELTSACKARSHNPAFADVKCCTTNTCNPPTDVNLWNYVGPANNTAHLSCYFNSIPGIDPSAAHSVVYGSWGGTQDTPKEAACLRYQQKNSKTGAPLNAWTYAAIDLDACDLETGKPLGNTYDSVAVSSTVMCCAEPDCNAPDPQLDTSTKAGPIFTQALLQQDPSFDVSTVKRVDRNTNTEAGAGYMAGTTSVGSGGDVQDDSATEEQLLESGVMPMGADGDTPGAYGGLADDGTYSSQVSPDALLILATPVTDNSAGTLEEGQYTTPSPPGSSAGVTAQAVAGAGSGSSSDGTTQAVAGAGAGSSAGTKTSGAGTVHASLSVVALTAAVGAALAMS